MDVREDITFRSRLSDQSSTPKRLSGRLSSGLMDDNSWIQNASSNKRSIKGETVKSVERSSLPGRLKGNDASWITNSTPSRKLLSEDSWLRSTLRTGRSSGASPGNDSWIMSGSNANARKRYTSPGRLQIKSTDAQSWIKSPESKEMKSRSSSDSISEVKAKFELKASMESPRDIRSQMEDNTERRAKITRPKGGETSPPEVETMTGKTRSETQHRRVRSTEQSVTNMPAPVTEDTNKRSQSVNYDNNKNDLETTDLNEENSTRRRRRRRERNQGSQGEIDVKEYEKSVKEYEKVWDNNKDDFKQEQESDNDQNQYTNRSRENEGSQEKEPQKWDHEEMGHCFERQDSDIEFQKRHQKEGDREEKIEGCGVMVEDHVEHEIKHEEERERNGSDRESKSSDESTDVEKEEENSNDIMEKEVRLSEEYRDHSLENGKSINEEDKIIDEDEFNEDDFLVNDEISSSQEKEETARTEEYEQHESPCSEIMVLESKGSELDTVFVNTNTDGNVVLDAIGTEPAQSMGFFGGKDAFPGNGDLSMNSVGVELETDIHVTKARPEAENGEYGEDRGEPSVNEDKCQSHMMDETNDHDSCKQAPEKRDIGNGQPSPVSESTLVVLGRDSGWPCSTGLQSGCIAESGSTLDASPNHSSDNKSGYITPDDNQDTHNSDNGDSLEASPSTLEGTPSLIESGVLVSSQESVDHVDGDLPEHDVNDKVADIHSDSPLLTVTPDREENLTVDSESDNYTGDRILSEKENSPEVDFPGTELDKQSFTVSKAEIVLATGAAKTPLTTSNQAEITEAIESDSSWEEEVHQDREVDQTLDMEADNLKEFTGEQSVRENISLGHTSIENPCVEADQKLGDINFKYDEQTLDEASVGTSEPDDNLTGEVSCKQQFIALAQEEHEEDLSLRGEEYIDNEMNTLTVQEETSSYSVGAAMEESTMVQEGEQVSNDIEIKTNKEPAIDSLENKLFKGEESGSRFKEEDFLGEYEAGPNEDPSDSEEDGEYQEEEIKAGSHGGEQLRVIEQGSQLEKDTSNDQMFDNVERESISSAGKADLYEEPVCFEEDNPKQKEELSNSEEAKGLFREQPLSQNEEEIFDKEHVLTDEMLSSDGEEPVYKRESLTMRSEDDQSIEYESEHTCVEKEPDKQTTESTEDNHLGHGQDSPDQNTEVILGTHSGEIQKDEDSLSEDSQAVQIVPTHINETGSVQTEAVVGEETENETSSDTAAADQLELTSEQNQTHESDHELRRALINAGESDFGESSYEADSAINKIDTEPETLFESKAVINLNLCHDAPPEGKISDNDEEAEENGSSEVDYSPRDLQLGGTQHDSDAGDNELDIPESFTFIAEGGNEKKIDGEKQDGRVVIDETTDMLPEESGSVSGRRAAEEEENKTERPLKSLDYKKNSGTNTREDEDLLCDKSNGASVIKDKQLSDENGDQEENVGNFQVSRGKELRADKDDKGTPTGTREIRSEKEGSGMKAEKHTRSLGSSDRGNLNVENSGAGEKAEIKQERTDTAEQKSIQEKEKNQSHEVLSATVKGECKKESKSKDVSQTLQLSDDNRYYIPVNYSTLKVSKRYRLSAKAASTMVNGNEEVCWDHLILEVFEESDTIFFPLQTQKEARSFVKALHLKGQSFEEMCREIGEHEHNFNSWRKSLGRAGIGHSVMRWANRPLQDLLDESDEESNGLNDDDTNHAKDDAQSSEEERKREIECKERLQPKVADNAGKKSLDYNKNDKKQADLAKESENSSKFKTRESKSVSPPPQPKETKPLKQKYDQEPDPIRMRRLEEFKKEMESGSKGLEENVRDVRKRISMFENKTSPSKSNSESREDVSKENVEGNSKTESESVSSGSQEDHGSSPEPEETISFAKDDPKSSPELEEREEEVRTVEKVESEEEEEEVEVEEEEEQGEENHEKPVQEVLPTEEKAEQETKEDVQVARSNTSNGHAPNTSTAEDNKAKDSSEVVLPGVDENYNSDLDPDNDMQSPMLTAAVKKISASRSNKNWSGFLYVFSDTPGNSETCRVKVGVSSFPHKRLRQAQLFNPNIYQVKIMAVKQRSTAFEDVLNALEEYRMSNQKDWFEGPFNDLLEAVSDVASRYPSSRKILTQNDGDDEESAC